jgi:hypothetical protein
MLRWASVEERLDLELDTYHVVLILESRLEVLAF